jgi:tetratricopeptide (TPR) repeat protein
MPRKGPILLLLASSLPCVGVAAQPSEASRWIAHGDSLLRIEKPQRALDAYEQAVKADPSAVSYVARARALLALERMDRFLLDVEQALKLDSALAEAHRQRALYALRGNDPAKAEYHAGRAVAHAQDADERNRALVLRGEARADQRKMREAIADLAEAWASGHEDTGGMATLARLYDETGDHASSLKVLERLCELEPMDVGHWSNRGFELIMLERYADALPVIEQALLLDRDEPVALSNRAYVYLRTGQDKEAWSDVERSLKSYPANPFALRTRALLRLRKGEKQKACEDLTLARALGQVSGVDALIEEHCGQQRPQRK